MPKTKPLDPDQLADNAIQPVIKKIADGKTTHSEIAAAMTESTRKSVTRQMVGRWTHPEPEKRDEPRLGAALALIVTTEEITTGKRPGVVTISTAAPKKPAAKKPAKKSKK